MNQVFVIFELVWIQEINSKLNGVRTFKNNLMKTVFFVNSQNWRRTTVVSGQTVEFHKIHFNSTKNTSATLTFGRNIFAS